MIVLHGFVTRLFCRRLKIFVCEVSFLCIVLKLLFKNSLLISVMNDIILTIDLLSVQHVHMRARRGQISLHMRSAIPMIGPINAQAADMVQKLAVT